MNNFGLGILIQAKDQASAVFQKVERNFDSLSKKSDELASRMQTSSKTFYAGKGLLCLERRVKSLLHRSLPSISGFYTTPLSTLNTCSVFGGKLRSMGKASCRSRAGDRPPEKRRAAGPELSFGRARGRAQRHPLRLRKKTYASSCRTCPGDRRLPPAPDDWRLRKTEFHSRVGRKHDRPTALRGKTCQDKRPPRGTLPKNRASRHSPTLSPLPELRKNVLFRTDYVSGIVADHRDL